MVTTSGNLFHIDFGHFLGNIKYIMVSDNHFMALTYTIHLIVLSLFFLFCHFSLLLQGFKREWAPFVLTPDFVWVMGGEVYIRER